MRIHERTINRDLCGGALFVVIGAVVSMQGYSYGTGSPTQMGAGFFPAALGAALMALGALIAANGLLPRRDESETVESIGTQTVGTPGWRGFTAIVFGVLSFIAVGYYFGLAPAAFCCVFISALGDRHSSVKGAAILALAMSCFAVCFFSLLLQVQFPLFRLPVSWVNP
jgi:hypothetical protein